MINCVVGWSLKSGLFASYATFSLFQCKSRKNFPHQLNCVIRGHSMALPAYRTLLLSISAAHSFALLVALLFCKIASRRKLINCHPFRSSRGQAALWAPLLRTHFTLLCVSTRKKKAKRVMAAPRHAWLLGRVRWWKSSEKRLKRKW